MYTNKVMRFDKGISSKHLAGNKFTEWLDSIVSSWNYDVEHIAKIFSEDNREIILEYNMFIDACDSCIKEISQYIGFKDDTVYMVPVNKYLQLESYLL
jgi:hypothetical protein